MLYVGFIGYFAVIACLLVKFVLTKIETNIPSSNITKRQCENKRHSTQEKKALSIFAYTHAFHTEQDEKKQHEIFANWSKRKRN